ncbi:MAG: Fpg/Nei family DNA glycosylase [Dehalococcoidia bacterium]|nr:Fpg/Nei family DNA glycosylase [Dehalococcoidia bacterium]
MPEGDALYRFAEKLRPALDGKIIRAARSHGPGPVPRVEKIVGQRCTGVRSQGKNMLIGFENGLALRGHLRMYGTWHVYEPGERWTRPEREVRLVLEVDGAVVVNFGAPVIELVEERSLGYHAPVSNLGPDLLDDAFDAEEALQRLRHPTRAMLTIGDAIMDQRAVAGVGNIWKHEALFHAGVNPWRRVSDLSDDDVRRLLGKAQGLLRASVGKENALGLTRRPTMNVYMRGGQPCRRCRTTLRSAPQGVDIRHTAWCPKCQPVVEGQLEPPRSRRDRPLVVRPGETNRQLSK